MLESVFNLTNRVALITGGSKGLGKAIACLFVQAGARVIITSRHQDELESAVTEISPHIGASSAGIEYRVADLSRRADAEQLAAGLLREHERVDILVNNAGSNCPMPTDAIRDDEWDRLFELNVTSPMVLTRALSRGMMEQKWGRIIHMSSVLGVTGKEGRACYCATKAALIGMARASALDLGPHGVTVNCIAPGPFLTDLPMSILSPEQQQHFADRTALGRWGQPEELAPTALLLASDAGRYITGTTILVDGGVSCKGL